MKHMISMVVGLLTMTTALAIGGPMGARTPVRPNSAEPRSQLTLASGRQVYARNCARCHGADAKGKKGPALAGRTLNQDEIAEMITTGQPPKMPAFGKQLSSTEIQAVAAYVRSLGSRS